MVCLLGVSAYVAVLPLPTNLGVERHMRCWCFDDISSKWGMVLLSPAVPVLVVGGNDCEKETAFDFLSTSQTLSAFQRYC